MCIANIICAKQLQHILQHGIVGLVLQILIVPHVARAQSQYLATLGIAIVTRQWPVEGIDHRTGCQQHISRFGDVQGGSVWILKVQLVLLIAEIVVNLFYVQFEQVSPHRFADNASAHNTLFGMEILVVMRTHHIIVIDIDAILLQKEVYVRIELLLPALAQQHEQTST